MRLMYHCMDRYTNHEPECLISCEESLSISDT